MTGCCVCMKDVESSDSLFEMPCCSSSILKYCSGCLAEMVDKAENQQPNCANCPVCNKVFKFQEETIEKVEVRGQCRMCCQQRVLIDKNLCDNCLIGE